MLGEKHSFVRIGKKSARLVRMAATRLAVELLAMIQRPAHASITKTLEGYVDCVCFSMNLEYCHFS
jgi:hypothetical protein